MVADVARVAVANTTEPTPGAVNVALRIAQRLAKQETRDAGRRGQAGPVERDAEAEWLAEVRVGEVGQVWPPVAVEIRGDRTTVATSGADESQHAECPVPGS